jgi:hypothetical protein
VFKDEAMLRYSLALTCGVATIFALVLLVYNLRLFRAGVEEAEQWLGETTTKTSG